jgi:hypothetical protein
MKRERPPAFSGVRTLLITRPASTCVHRYLTSLHLPSSFLSMPRHASPLPASPQLASPVNLLCRTTAGHLSQSSPRMVPAPRLSNSISNLHTTRSSGNHFSNCDSVKIDAATDNFLIIISWSKSNCFWIHREQNEMTTISMHRSLVRTFTRSPCIPKSYQNLPSKSVSFSNQKLN